MGEKPPVGGEPSKAIGNLMTQEIAEIALLAGADPAKVAEVKGMLEGDEKGRTSEPED